MKIGIETNTKLVYEASNGHGFPLWPLPVMLQVIIASEEDTLFKAAKFDDLSPRTLIFREDAYNSSSRVRRGRLYKAGDTQPVEWSVYPHPAMPLQLQRAMQQGGTLKKGMYTFASFRLRSYLNERKIHRPIFILGSENGFTIWSLVNIETSATGDEMVVLRARKSIGALPHLDGEKILELDGKSVIDLVDKLEEELFQAGPESIIDRAREAATAILSKYLQSIGKTKPGNDLGRLVRLIEDEELENVANAARIIARFHARGKHAEQEMRPLRQITEHDAEFAVQAVATILCDLDWAHW